MPLICYFLQSHEIPSAIREENIIGNYLLVSKSHIICYKHPHHVNLVVPLEQVSGFKLSKTCDYCVMVSKKHAYQLARSKKKTTNMDKQLSRIGLFQFYFG